MKQKDNTEIQTKQKIKNTSWEFGIHKNTKDKISKEKLYKERKKNNKLTKYK